VLIPRAYSDRTFSSKPSSRVCRFLSAAGVEFLVVGAHELAAHGHVRATGDLDVLVRPTLDNARKLERAIREFASTSLDYFGVSAEELSTPRVGFYMGVEPDRIYVLTRIGGVGFDPR